MTRLEIITRFREECPEITDRVISDAVLNSWCIVGNQEICARARLIVTTTPEVINAVASQEMYDLSAITNFYDVDKYPGGGIRRVDTSGNKKRLVEKSIAELDDMSSSWRTASAGTPRYYYRRGKYFGVYPTPDSTIDYFEVDAVLIADDFNNDTITPYNQLQHLEPFHYGLVKYLVWRAKGKVGKPQDAATAMAEYLDYIKWIVREIGGGKYNVIYYRPKT